MTLCHHLIFSANMIEPNRLTYLYLRGNELSVPFQEMVLKRDLPDYYRVIKTPMALTTIQVNRFIRLLMCHADDMNRTK